MKKISCKIVIFYYGERYVKILFLFIESRKDVIRKTPEKMDSQDGDVRSPEAVREKRSISVSSDFKILRVVKRDATEMADVETTEKVIRVNFSSY